MGIDVKHLEAIAARDCGVTLEQARRVKEKPRRSGA